MQAEQRRISRLRRLEKVRAMAKQAALLEAAEAEGTLQQLRALAERTQAMSEDYRARREASDGLALRNVASFVTALGSIQDATRRDARSAEALANARQQDLALAERRRAAVEERARSSQRALDLRQTAPASGARRPLGTGLE